MSGSSATSDDSGYLQACVYAARTDAGFRTFRTNAGYTRVLEHVNVGQGQEYLAEIAKGGLYGNPALIKRIADVNDSKGGAQLANFAPFGQVSPTTLRYIKVLSDLVSLFGPLGGKRIVEIGAGYGGQCRATLTAFPDADYTTVDLKEACLLTRRYLEETAAPAKSWQCIPFEDLKKLDGQKYDLVVSNYAFSEMTASVRNLYLETIIKNCSNGYLTMNSFTPAERDDLHAKLASYGRLVHLLPETPLTGPINYIVTWTTPRPAGPGPLI